VNKLSGDEPCISADRKGMVCYIRGSFTNRRIGAQPAAG
jgi:hypothetical protein